MRSTIKCGGTLTLLLLAMQLGGCATAPKDFDKETFAARAAASTDWFKTNVNGLGDQIDGSAGYIIFPDVAQWGILFGGGTWGRGALYTPDGELRGWSAINRGSIGLQVGVQGFRMLLVLQNQTTLDQFTANKWAGAIGGVAVVGEAGASGKAPFTSGVAVYEGANSGLMAGVDVGLKYIRYQPLGAE